MNCGVYKLTFANGEFYIGSSVRAATRQRQHLRALAEGSHSNFKMQKLFDALEEDVEFKLLIICKKEDLLFYEQIFIDKLKPTLNISSKAGSFSWPEESRLKMRKSRLGKRLSEETKKKISLSKIGKKRPDVSLRTKGKPGHKWTSEQRVNHVARMKGNKQRLGHKQSEEEIAKRAAALRGNQNAKGMTHSEAARRKMSAALLGNKRLLGKRHSAETRLKMSKSHLKRKENLTCA